MEILKNRQNEYNLYVNEYEKTKGANKFKDNIQGADTINSLDINGKTVKIY